MIMQAGHMGPICFQGSNDGLTTDIKGNKAMSFINRSHKNSWVGSRCTGRQKGKTRLSRVTCSISDSVSVQCFTGILSSQLSTGWYFFSKTLLITSFFFFLLTGHAPFLLLSFSGLFFFGVYLSPSMLLKSTIDLWFLTDFHNLLSVKELYWNPS